MSEKKRARSIEEYQVLMGRVFSRGSAAPAPAYTPRPDDVVITPFAKSGTTWLQQIFHTLRTRGDMAFDDISRVVPWLETASALGIDLDAEQRGQPRGFKSHLPRDKIPAGARYINAIRHPNDAAYSMFKFAEGWSIEPGTITADEFIQAMFLNSSDYFHHLLTWWETRDDDDVLYLVYEHMNQDLDGTISKVAEFIGIELDDELRAITTEHASLGYMLQHKDRFDDAMMRSLTERMLPKGSDSAKVREGKVGGHRDALSNETVSLLDEKWKKEVTPVLGFDSYDAMIRSLV